MTQRAPRLWREALEKLRNGAGGTTTDPVDRMFAASRRWFSGCQNQYDALHGIWDEVKEGRYRSDRIVPDTLALWSGFFDEALGTWEVLCKGEADDDDEDQA